MFKANLCALIATVLLFSVQRVAALGTPFGYATGVTGGGSASSQTPSSLDELKTWLSDSTPRRITLDRVWDFSTYFGTTTGAVCSPYSCSPNPQQMIDGTNNWCSGKSTTTATYNNAGTTNSDYLQVGSNKTLLGQGSNSGIKGVGLRMSGGVSNIIIQNIKITDINARYVWGGDAISIDEASDIWIDHNYINRIGRQFIVTGFGTVTGLTISNNFFDGQADYATGCDNHHYWALLIAGAADRITFAYNRLYYTAGRGPHVGGAATDIFMHIVNNYFDSISGHALDTEIGSSVLAEGNYFYNVVTPKTDNVTGKTYFVTSSNAGTCTSSLGRTCQANTLSGSGSVSAEDSAVLSSMGGETAFRSITPIAASAVQEYVLANAGVGKFIS